MRTRLQTQRSHGVLANQVSRLPLLASDRGALNILDGLSGDSTEELLSNSAVLPTYLT